MIENGIGPGNLNRTAKMDEIRRKKASLLITSFKEKIRDAKIGIVPIYTNSIPVNEYRTMRRCFPECFRGHASNQWLWKQMIEEGLIICTQGLKGKLVATLAPEKEGSK